uniref:Uncharacterized protein n=1 Tax=Craspedostauros australis TaxID=1486917 RepID=A0A7R9WST1_9STRA|mmetsp:Transcript_19285/g.53642  ORF Transcript_19285/g.53642 Transcript_19285/m.53642 type:complete len:401 (+) Transcript_19285:128-1330(+)
MTQPMLKLKGSSRPILIGLILIVCWVVLASLFQLFLVERGLDVQRGQAVSPGLLMGDGMDAADSANGEVDVDSLSSSQLWLDNRFDETVLHALHVCHDTEHCTAPPHSHNPIKLGVLIPPGRFGRLCLEYLKQFLIMKYSAEGGGDAPDIQVMPTSNLPLKWKSDNDGGGNGDAEGDAAEYSLIVHFVSLPLLLAVGDVLLAMMTDDEVRHFPAMSLADVQQTAEILMEWHCSITRKAGDQIPVLTLTLDQIMDDAIEVEDALTEFLGNWKADEELRQSDSEDTLSEGVALAVTNIKRQLRALEIIMVSNKDEDAVHDLRKEIDRIVNGYLRGQDECPTVGDPMTAATPIAKRLLPVLSPLLEGEQIPCKDAEHALEQTSHCKHQFERFSAKQLMKDRQQ